MMGFTGRAPPDSSSDVKGRCVCARGRSGRMRRRRGCRRRDRREGGSEGASRDTHIPNYASIDRAHAHAQAQTLFESPVERHRAQCRTARAGPQEDLPASTREHLVACAKESHCSTCPAAAACPVWFNYSRPRRACVHLLTDAAPCLAPIWPCANGLRSCALLDGDVHQIEMRVTWL